MNLDKLLLTDYAVSDVDLEKAKSYQQRFGGRLEKLLVNMGSLAEDALPSLYSTLFDLPILDNDVSSSEEVELPKWAASLPSVGPCPEGQTSPTWSGIGGAFSLGEVC